MTLVQDEQQKVHYPLPLNPVETGPFLMDKETMKRMVSRMSQTLTEFKTLNSTVSSGNGSAMFGRHTAKEFFSRENLTHPLVEENQKLREKLKLLESAKSERGGAVSMHAIH